MTPAAILKAINALPTDERMEIIEKVIHSIHLEAPKKSKRKKNPDNPSPVGLFD